MASSPVAVCNLALSRIGQPPIMSFEDNTKAAQLCATAYDPSRKAMLRAMRPDFSKKRVSVGALGTPPVWGYANHGQLPSDCLLVIEVEQPETVRWGVEERTILTDWSMPLNIVFVRDETNTGIFDSTYEDALADQIAAEVVFGLTKNMAYRDKFYATAAHKAGLAQNVDAQQGSPEIPPANQLIDVRR